MKKWTAPFLFGYETLHGLFFYLSYTLEQTYKRAHYIVMLVQKEKKLSYKIKFYK